MKIKITHLAAFAGVLLAGAPFIFFSKELAIHRMVNISSAAENDGEGMEDDPYARQKWELMRNRDPITGKIPENIHALELEFAKTIPTHESIYGSGTNKTGISWVQRGPVNVGGRTRALALDVTNENIVLAGGASGGMWRSIDAGKTWAQTTSANQLKTITCAVQDKRSGKQNIWYAGTGEAYGGNVVAGDGFFKSLDSGQSWQPMLAINKPAGFYYLHYIWNICTNPANASKDELYIASYGGIFRSTNGGDSIKAVLGGVSNTFGLYSMFTDVTVTPKGVIYATLSNDGPIGKAGIFRSTDGITWTNITPKNFAATYNRIVMGYAPSNENVVYFLASTPDAGFAGISWDGKSDYNSFWKYTYVSGTGKDSPNVWENRSGSLPDYHHGHPWIFGDFSTQGGYDMLVKVKPDDENVVVIGGTNLYRSDNGFKDRSKTSWIGGYNRATDILQDYVYKSHHPDQHNFLFLPSNYNTAYSSCDGGVFRTDNALDTQVAWQSLNHSYTTTQFYTIALNPAPKLGHKYSDIILGGLQDNNSWLTRVNAAPNTPWEPWFRGDGGYCAVIDNDTATFMYTSLQLGKIRKDVFDKTGKNLGWARIDPIGAKGYLFIAPFILDAANRNTMYLAAGDYIWRNDSLGAIPLIEKNDSIHTGWKQLSGSQVPFSIISSLATSITPAHRLYYGTYDGRVFRLDNADTGNAVATEVTGPLFNGAMYMSCLAVDPKDGDKVIAVCSNYNVRSLFYTTDAGKTWTDISANLEQKPDGLGNGPSCRWAKIMYGSDGNPYYFIGASTGLYMARTLASKNTLWVQEGSYTIGNMDVEMIDGRSSDGVIVAGTYGAGVFSANLSVLIGIDKDKPAAKGFFLESIFPNPVHEETTLSFLLDKPAKLEVQLIDIYGKIIKSSDPQNYAEGKHNLSLDMSGLKPGTYFCRITVNGASEVKKVLKL